MRARVNFSAVRKVCSWKNWTDYIGNKTHRKSSVGGTFLRNSLNTQTKMYFAFAPIEINKVFTFHTCVHIECCVEKQMSSIRSMQLALNSNELTSFHFLLVQIRSKFELFTRHHTLTPNLNGFWQTTSRF